MTLYGSFRLGGTLYGVPLSDIKEINREMTFTPVPPAPPEVRGYVNLRGQVHLVLDLRRLLGLAEAEGTEDSRLVVFKAAVGEAFAVVVDEVGDVVDTDEVEPRPGGELVAGIARRAGELMVVLNARRLLPAAGRAISGETAS